MQPQSDNGTLLKTLEGLAESFDQAGELYRSLFEKNHFVKLLISPETGKIFDANHAACRFYGYAREALKGMSIVDINTLSPEEVKEEMRKAKEEKRNHFHFIHRRADGTHRDVEVYTGPIALGGQNLLYSIIHDITERVQAERDRDIANLQLRKAHEEIKMLKGILPICSFCKRVRDTSGSWQQIDAYIHTHTKADVSHGICPQCTAREYPELANDG